LSTARGRSGDRNIVGLLRIRGGTINYDAEGDPDMMAIYGPLRLILDIAYFMMIVHIIMSWLINFQVLNIRQPLVGQIWYGLNRLLEPIYVPIRRILPNTGALDLAPLVAFVIVISLRDYILPTLLF
jgi:YggT family protein